MAKTELTKEIKKATHSFRPQMGRLRTIRYADEVWSPHGIVDSIRFEDYETEKEEYCIKIEGVKYADNNIFYENLLKKTGKGTCKIGGRNIPE